MLPFPARLSFVSLLLVCLATSHPPALAVTEAGPRQRPLVPGAEDTNVARVIVKYRADSGLVRALSLNPKGAGAGNARVLPQHANTLARRLGLRLSDGRVLGERTQALRGEGVSSTDLAQRLRADADVEWAEVDGKRYVTAAPNDPYFKDKQTSITPAVGQWYLRAPDATQWSAINALAAWDITTGSPTVTVAVLDTGVRLDHPDFADVAGKSKFHAGYDFVSDATTSGDGGGRDSDATDPGDWRSAGECGLGMAGAGRNVMLLPVRVLGKCGGQDSDIIAAMRWAAGVSATPVKNEHPAKVINMSLGASGPCSLSYGDVFRELASAGVTVVVAAGNDAGLKVSSPANCNGALAVAGLRHLGTKVGYSSLGPEVAMAAPAGNCVNSSGACLYPLITTTNSGTTTPSGHTYSDGTNYSVGTSFAAPLVAGTVALMLSVDSTLSPAAIRTALQTSARQFPNTGAAATVAACTAPTFAEQPECYCTTSTCGAGMLDAAAAVAAAKASAVPPPTAAISVSSSTPTVGAAVTLSAAASLASAGRTIAAYQWQITAGENLASFSGITTGSSATLATKAIGAVTVLLTVTDSAGAKGSASVTINVQAAVVPPPTVEPVTTGDTSSSGGGAMSVAWVFLLLLAVLALRRADSRRRAC
jgi:serine protease